MLKYRDAKHIRSGFIGVVLIMLTIAVGLAPERLVSWATTIHYQALFSEAGGIAAGNNVLVSGVKVGTVSEVSLREGDALVTFAANGKVRLGSQTTAHIRTGSLLGARVLTLEPAGSGRMHPVRCHTDVQDILALFTERGRLGRDHEPGRHEHQYPQPIVGRTVDDDRPDRSTIGPDVRRAHPTVAGNQQPR